MLDRTILDDFYLGNLICQSILVAIDAKMNSYHTIPESTARCLLSQSKKNRTMQNSSSCEREMEGNAQNMKSATVSDKSKKHQSNQSPLHRDQSLLQTLLLSYEALDTKDKTACQPTNSSSANHNQVLHWDILRAMYGLTVRIEELLSLEYLRREILDVMQCLADGYSLQFPGGDHTYGDPPVVRSSKSGEECGEDLSSNENEGPVESTNKKARLS